MTTWRLRETVTLRGCDWFGRPAALIIAPNGGNEWWWNGSRISPELLTPMWRGVALAAHSHRLLEFEHLGALRHLGLRGISLYGKGWPPHYGRAFDVWEALQPACYTVQDPVPWVTVREPVHWTYPGQRGDGIGYTEIRPWHEPKLIVHVEISYAGLGTYSCTYRFPDDALLYSMWSAWTQGWPTWLRHGAALLDRFGWPHRHTIQWAVGQREQVLEQFALHRVQDLLGVLSVLCETGLFAGIVTSRCSGHLADVQAVRAAKLVPINEEVPDHLG